MSMSNQESARIDGELDLEEAVRALDKGYRPGEWTFYAATAVLPFFAPFIAIFWLAKNRVGPGLAILLTGWVATALWFLVAALVGIANT